MRWSANIHQVAPTVITSRRSGLWCSTLPMSRRGPYSSTRYMSALGSLRRSPSAHTATVRDPRVALRTCLRCVNGCVYLRAPSEQLRVLFVSLTHARTLCPTPHALASLSLSLCLAFGSVCLAHALSHSCPPLHTAGNNNGNSPEHLVMREIKAVQPSGVEVLPATVMPAGSIVNTAYQMQNLQYDLSVPGYGNNIDNFRPTRMYLGLTTTRANSKIFVRTNLVLAPHTASHVCECSPFHDDSPSYPSTYTRRPTHAHARTHARTALILLLPLVFSTIYVLGCQTSTFGAKSDRGPSSVSPGCTAAATRTE